MGTVVASECRKPEFAAPSHGAVGPGPIEGVPRAQARQAAGPDEESTVVNTDTQDARAARRSAAVFENLLAGRGYSMPSPAQVAKLVAATNRSSLLMAARLVAADIAGGTRPFPVDLVLEATAAARGLPNWDTLAASLRKREQQGAAADFPVYSHWREGDCRHIPDLVSMMREWDRPSWSMEGKWLEAAQRIDGASWATDVEKAFVWKQVHPEGKAGFFALIASAVARGCTLTGENSMGAPWYLKEWARNGVDWDESKQIAVSTPSRWVEVPQSVVWDMARLKLIHLPIRREKGNFKSRYQAFPAPTGCAWRGERLVGEPKARIDALIWLTSRLAHAREEKENSHGGVARERFEARAKAYQARLLHLKQTTPCKTCDGGEEQVLMLLECEACEGSGYEFDA